jgi:hypothetical protein
MAIPASLKQRALVIKNGAVNNLRPEQIEARNMSLYQFVLWAWPILEPGAPFVDNRGTTILRNIADHSPASPGRVERFRGSV